MRKILLALIFFVVSVAAVSPNQIHLSTTSDPSNSISITWQTPSSTASSVEYGLSSSLGSSVSGSQYQYSGYNGYMHVATLSSLTPGTAYYYRVGDGTDWSAVYSFKTAPAVGSTAPFTLVTWGDQGYRNEEVPNAAAAINPDLVAIAGDLAYSGDEDDVDEFFESEQLLASKAILMAAPGNHEYNEFGPNSDTLNSFVNRFAFPSNSMYSYLNERTYSFNYGNAHFAFLDLGRSVGDDEDQVNSDNVAAWLDADLAAVPSGITWKVIVLHFNLYSSSDSHSMDGAQDERRRFEPIFRSRGVDLVIYGHVHAYERMYPLADPDVATDPDGDNVVYETDYVDPAYPVYLLAGTGGNCCYDRGGGVPWSVVALAETGYVKLVFSGNTLSQEFRSPAQALRDSFTITKNTPINSGTNASANVSSSINTSSTGSSSSSTQLFDFVVSVPSSVSMLQGNSAVLAINGTQLFGPLQTASLYVDCPAGVSCSFNTTSAQFNFSANLFISTSSSTPVGNSPITISATSAGITHSVVLTLNVYSPISCTETWQCTGWSSCIDNLQMRTCIDLNNCETNANPPPEQEKQCNLEQVSQPVRPNVQNGLPIVFGGGEQPREGNFLNSIIAIIVSFFSWLVGLFA